MIQARMPVAILGTGNIGTDLLAKVLRNAKLECKAFLGRRAGSPSMAWALERGVQTSPEGIGYIEAHPSICDLVFDATSADDHLVLHAPILERLGKIVIDLTPARIGTMIVPVVNGSALNGQQNVNTVTCGGQASIPVACALARDHEIDYVEVVSSIASKSAGPATRRNLDDYIHTTERGLKLFTGAKQSKAILNLNPAEPCVNMQTTILAKISGRIDLPGYRRELTKMISALQTYVPGYETIVEPTLDQDRIVTMIRVTGRGDYLPSFAGNLDIINCAAIAIAEKYAERGGAR